MINIAITTGKMSRNLFQRILLQQHRNTHIISVIHRQEYHQYKNYGDERERRERDKRKFYGKITAAIFSSVYIGSTLSDKKQKNELQPLFVTVHNAAFEAGEKRPDLPTYTAEEVSKHDNKDSFWVTYKHGVYDVTDFLPSHPGGEQIYNAAGLSVEPFWNVYGMHKTEQVYRLLESYRIGNLTESDVVSHDSDELWAREPRRDPRLLVRTPRPFNAETPAPLLATTMDTPNELFYVRQHMPVPDLDPATHRLTVEVKVDGRCDRYEFTMEELETLFPTVEVRAALMCAGNRRSEMTEEVTDKTVKGIPWSSGAVGSARWSGVRLGDVLRHCGVTARPGLHVVMRGADVDATGAQFSTSVELRAALAPGALLAARMNGAPLPRDHGRPLRALLPGAPAVRSVKWLESITVSTEESTSHWHVKDYRAFNPSDTWETADFSTAPPVYSLPVTAAVCRPAHGDTVRPVDRCVELRGYAYSGGGAKILRVDVTGDGGATWRSCSLEQDTAPHGQHYAWTLWTARLPVTTHDTEMEIWVKATDANFNTQPENFRDIWNIRGILSNAYHKIKIKIEQ